MDARLMSPAEIGRCLRASLGSQGSADLLLCPVSDLYLSVEQARKESENAGALHGIRECTTEFHRLCGTGEVMVLQLTSSVLQDQVFLDSHVEDLALDPEVVGATTPEASVRVLNVKDVQSSWGWTLK